MSIFCNLFSEISLFSGEVDQCLPENGRQRQGPGNPAEFPGCNRIIGESSPGDQAVCGSFPAGLA